MLLLRNTEKYVAKYFCQNTSFNITDKIASTKFLKLFFLILDRNNLANQNLSYDIVRSLIPQN